jgi:hypothetical protein
VVVARVNEPGRDPSCVSCVVAWIVAAPLLLVGAVWLLSLVVEWVW